MFAYRRKGSPGGEEKRGELPVGAERLGPPWKRLSSALPRSSSRKTSTSCTDSPSAGPLSKAEQLRNRPQVVWTNTPQVGTRLILTGRCQSAARCCKPVKKRAEWEESGRLPRPSAVILVSLAVRRAGRRPTSHLMTLIALWSSAIGQTFFFVPHQEVVTQIYHTALKLIGRKFHLLPCLVNK